MASASDDSTESDYDDEELPDTSFGASRCEALHKQMIFEEGFNAETAHLRDARKMDQLLCVSTLPAVFKTGPTSAKTVDVPLEGLSSVQELIERVAHLGSKKVDADITEDVIRLHVAFEDERKRPRRLTFRSRTTEMEGASTLIITPAK